ncbi:MAG TPA: hypothetical protein VEZ20_15555 [Allosphingosinicella sp.]|jgi:hypothetical protein|nr:hypothetical protein [Allosphingosinicella sp.]
MEAEPPCSVGLAGDGDEIAAVDHVEAAFGVQIDVGDAPRWRTAGDVFESLLKALPPATASDPATWERFTEALAFETGIEPRLIARNSPLLLPDTASRGCQALWIGAAVLGLALLLVAVLV